MKYNPNEPYSVWVEKVRKFEHGHALQRIANGDPVDAVLETMSKRIMEKLVFPLRNIVKETKPTNIDKTE